MSLAIDKFGGNPNANILSHIGNFNCWTERTTIGFSSLFTRKFYKFLKLEYLYLQQREPIILIFVHLGFTLRWLVAARCACGA